MHTNFDKCRAQWAFCFALLLSILFSAAAEKAQAQQTPPAAPARPAAPASGAGPIGAGPIGAGPIGAGPIGAGQGAASASDIALARRLVIASGMARSFTVIIPQFMDQIGTALTQTRPELINDLNEVMTQLKPEFDKQADEMIDTAAQIYAKHLSEQDLRAVVAFFESSAGKQYVETQPALLNDVVTAMQGWQGKISTDMMARVRAEMKQKGHEL